MKIQIRKSCFETNSSSNHAIILTNKKYCDNDIRALKHKLKTDYGCCSESSTTPITSKEEKVVLLASLFDYNIYDMYWMEDEYDIFISVLKDNNETELLNLIQENKEKFLENPGTPLCREYFFDDVLNDCTCCFYSVFQKYFNIYFDKCFYEAELVLNEKLTYEEFIKNQKKKLYDRLYKFIYEDGVIVPYEYL